jgi:hypothetical protein
VSQPFFDLSATIEIWSAIYQATKQAHVYGAGARGRAGQARDGVWGALRRGVEAGRGDVSAPLGSACTGTRVWAGADGRARVGEVGWGVGRLVACLGRTRG